MPSLRKISSKAALNLLSRSWIRKRVRSNRPEKLRDRFDSEEVARQDARRLPAQKLPPACPAAPGRGCQSGHQQEPPDRARRDTHTQLQELTRDPRAAPARVLPRQAQDELANTTLDRRPAAGPLRLRPPAASELSVPAQQRLRRHDQPAPTARREQP